MNSIETPRLLLREFRESDAKDLFEYAKLDSVGPNAGWVPHKDIEASRATINFFRSSGGIYALELKENHKVIGSLGIHDSTPFPILSTFTQKEIGYAMSPSYWHKGYMQEAIRAVLDYLFFEVNIELVWCGHFNFNKRSQNTVLKSGFREYKYYPYYARQLGRTFDSTYYYLTKADYQKFREQGYKNVPDMTFDLTTYYPYFSSARIDLFNRAPFLTIKKLGSIPYEEFFKGAKQIFLLYATESSIEEEIRNDEEKYLLYFNENAVGYLTFKKTEHSLDIYHLFVSKEYRDANFAKEFLFQVAKEELKDPKVIMYKGNSSIITSYLCHIGFQVSE